MKEIITIPNAPAPVGPYSQAIRAGQTLYVSGQIPINPFSGEMVSGDIQAETRQVMENIKALVESAGMQMADIVKCSIFLSDMHQYGLVNEVYATYFDAAVAPARECVEVANLPKFVRVEISAIAIAS